MRFFITYIILSLINAHASTILGGVDVGSGSKPFGVGINTPHFANEEQIKSYVKRLLPQLKTGKYQKVKHYIEQGNCTKNRVGFKGVEAIRVYDFDSKAAIFGKRDTGYISIILFNCKSPEKIIGDVKPN
jgi:hypothetical protein